MLFSVTKFRGQTRPIRQRLNRAGKKVTELCRTVRLELGLNKEVSELGLNKEVSELGLNKEVSELGGPRFGRKPDWSGFSLQENARLRSVLFR